jgi:hypothetical protein
MAKKKDGLSLKIDDRDLRGLLRSFSKMDDIAKEDMKKIAANIASKTAAAVIQAARSAPNPKQATAVASSIQVVTTSKDPSLKVIRKDVVTSSGGRSGELFTGSEFGSSNFKQFPSRSPKFGRGNEGYWLYKTLRERQPTMLREWLDGYKLIRDAWIKRVS